MTALLRPIVSGRGRRASRPLRLEARLALSGLAGEWGGPHRLVIEPGRATFHRGRPYQYALRLDASAGPAGYTLRPTGPGGAELSGIYKVEGDVLTLCYHPAGRQRPAAFEGPGGGTYTAVYKRVKR
jgi:hypothetical protein